MKPHIRTVARHLIQAEEAGKAARGFLRMNDEAAAYAQMQLQLTHLHDAEQALGYGVDQ